MKMICPGNCSGCSTAEPHEETKWCKQFCYGGNTKCVPYGVPYEPEKPTVEQMIFMLEMDIMGLEKSSVEDWIPKENREKYIFADTFAIKILKFLVD